MSHLGPWPAGRGQPWIPGGRQEASTASSVTVIAGDSAREITQLTLALDAISENCADVTPGTCARVTRWIAVIVGLLSTVSIVSCASVSIAVAVKPALSSVNDSAIVKQPACAAATSSSGFVPFPSPKRALKE